MKAINFQQFKKTFTNGAGRKERRFIEMFGNVSFEEAYPVYLKNISGFYKTKNRINAFESFLISKGVNSIQSNVSESRYYNWQGKKYRFSEHVYPTGSMTSVLVVDFAADPHLINEIDF